MIFRKKNIKIFLASSAELVEDITGFSLCVNNFNATQRKWSRIIEVYSWRDFISALSDKRTQDEYNEFISNSDVVVILIHTKIGSFTLEEYEIAVSTFEKKKKPLVYVYIKEHDNISSDVCCFKNNLEKRELFYGTYKDYNDLNLKFSHELQKLLSKGFFSDRLYVICNSLVFIALFILFSFFVCLCINWNVTVVLKEKICNTELVFEHGLVVFDDGENAKTEEVKDLKDLVVFTDIPGYSLLKPLHFKFMSNGFLTKDTFVYFRRNILLTVERDESYYGIINGYVADFTARIPVSNARVLIDNTYSALTDSMGYFECFIPLNKQKKYNSIIIDKIGYNQFVDSQSNASGKDIKYYFLTKY